MLPPCDHTCCLQILTSYFLLLPLREDAGISLGEATAAAAGAHGPLQKHPPWVKQAALESTHACTGQARQLVRHTPCCVLLLTAAARARTTHASGQHSSPQMSVRVPPGHGSPCHDLHTALCCAVLQARRRCRCCLHAAWRSHCW